MKTRPILWPLLLTLAACAPESPAPGGNLLSSLSKHGPLALSPDNPFLSANALVTETASESPEVRGFIEHRGNPQSIEVDSQDTGQLYLNFYYPADKQMYVLEKNAALWVISGPYTLSADKLEQLNHVNQGILLKSKINSEPETVPTSEISSAAETSSPSPPTTEGTETEPATPIASPKPNQDQLSETEQVKKIVESSPDGKAEISPRGDLIHYVVYNGETLSIIARWYTGDRANAGRIARTNSLHDPDELSIGDTIVVPSYLVKNQKRLTQDAIKSLTEVVNANQK